VKLTGTGVLAAAAIVIVGVVAWRAWRAAPAALDAAGRAINPTSPDNLAYRGVNAIGAAVTDPDGPGRNADGSWTLGGWLYDVTHPGWADMTPTVPQRQTGAGVPQRQTGAGGLIIDPESGLVVYDPTARAGGATGSW